MVTEAQTVLRELDRSLTLLYRELSQDYCELGGQTAVTRRAESALTQMLEALRTTFGSQDKIRDLTQANLYYKTLLSLEMAERIVIRAKKDAASEANSEQLRDQLQLCRQALANMREPLKTVPENVFETLPPKSQTPVTEGKSASLDEVVTVPTREKKQPDEPMPVETTNRPSSYQAETAVTFVQNLVEWFNDEEFQMLCFELKVDYDTLAGSGLNSKALQLYLKMRRYGRLEQLVQLLQIKRPHVSWELA